jgi:hypothetical protein
MRGYSLDDRKRTCGAAPNRGAELRSGKRVTETRPAERSALKTVSWEPRGGRLLALQRLVDYDLAVFFHRDDLVHRLETGQGNVDDIISRSHHDVDG